MTTLTKSFLCAALLCGVLEINASASAKKTPPPSTRGMVTAVDLKAKTITLEVSPDSPPQKCVLDDQSTIEINDKTATLKEVKSGLWVRSVRLDSSTPPVVEDLDLVSAKG